MELSNAVLLPCPRESTESVPPESQFNGGLGWTVKVSVRIPNPAVMKAECMQG